MHNNSLMHVNSFKTAGRLYNTKPGKHSDTQAHANNQKQGLLILPSSFVSLHQQKQTQNAAS